MSVISEREMYEQYNDMIDECCDVVSIFGMKYSPSRVLEEIDPVAYRCGFSDYVDGEGYVEHKDEDGDFDGWVHLDELDELEAESC